MVSGFLLSGFFLWILNTLLNKFLWTTNSLVPLFLVGLGWGSCLGALDLVISAQSLWVYFWCYIYLILDAKFRLCDARSFLPREWREDKATKAGLFELNRQLAKRNGTKGESHCRQNACLHFPSDPSTIQTINSEAACAPPLAISFLVISNAVKSFRSCISNSTWVPLISKLLLPIMIERCCAAMARVRGAAPGGA